MVSSSLETGKTYVLVQDRKNCLLFARGSTFFPLFRPSTDLLKPIILGKIICFIHSTNSNVNLIQSTDTVRIMFDQILCIAWPVDTEN